MGFWSKLGKGLLKVAPIAASFIPGVGPIAGMAIGAATNAASRKASGGSWADAALAGAQGAASGYGGAKGIGPSGKVATTGGGGWQDKLGGILGGGAGRDILGGSDQYKYRTPPFVANNYGPSDQQGGSNRFNFGGDEDEQQYPSSGSSQSGGGLSGFLSKLGGIKGIAGIGAGIGGALLTKKLLNNRSDRQEAAANAPQDYNPNPEPRDMGTSRFQRRMGRELGPIMGQSNQNNPNFALSIGQGRMDAMRDQPFRGGYEVRRETDYDEDTGQSTYEYSEMPRIGPGRRRRQDQYYGQREEAAY